MPELGFGVELQLALSLLDNVEDFVRRRFGFEPRPPYPQPDADEGPTEELS